MRRRAGRYEPYFGQANAVCDFFSQAQMGEMDGIEGPAQYADRA